MRILIRQAIANDATIASLGVVPEMVQAGDMDTPSGRPFINLRWSVTTPGLATVDYRDLTVWVHDEPGDYDRIDRIIRRIRSILADKVGVAHSYGYLVVVEWNGDSEDLVDDGHGTITRTTSFRIVGSGQ